MQPEPAPAISDDEALAYLDEADSIDRTAAKDVDRPPKAMAPATERLKSQGQSQWLDRQAALPFGVAYLDDQLRSIYARDLVLIGADTGAGKTYLGLHMAQNACRSGRRVAHFALEAHFGEMEQRLVYREVQRLAWKHKVDGRLELSFGAWANGLASKAVHGLDTSARSIVAQQATGLRTFYRQTRFTAADLVREVLAVASEVDLVVLDHCHYIDAEEDESEIKTVTATANALRHCSLVTGKPVLAIAHLRKRGAGRKGGELMPVADDFHGASQLTKVCTRIITLAPARDVPAVRGMAPTYMRVEKCRWDGVQGYAALVDFDLDKQVYADRYVLGRFGWADGRFQYLEPNEFPRWARRATTPRIG